MTTENNDRGKAAPAKKAVGPDALKAKVFALCRGEATLAPGAAEQDRPQRILGSQEAEEVCVTTGAYRVASTSKLAG